MMPELRSFRSLISQTSKEEFARVIPTLTRPEAEALLYDWEGMHARDKQLVPPGNWTTWLILAGRGFGKTRTGAETVRLWKESMPILHLVGATAGDVRDIMVEGESGILSVSPPSDRPTYSPSTRKLIWKNGSKALLFSADEPDRLRGPQCYGFWADELASWRYPEAWDQLQLGLRLGSNPRGIVTTTPRPTAIVKELARSPLTHLTKGNTYENRDNLAPTFFTQVITKYEGTRLGRQELEAEILEDVPGALWKSELIERKRVSAKPVLKRVVIAIDPAATSKETSDETGMVVAGLGSDGRGYVLDDLSGIYTPNGWALQAIVLYAKWMADRIIGETNNGGEMIETILRNLDSSISYKGVHAKRGKVLRAEPIVSLYEQGKVSHVGVLPQLETEMTTWDPKESPDSPNRIDALVYALTELMINKKEFILR